ncbi:MAG: hypothetical protein KGN02_04035 [bacterium]|nr:hypothetical protein [bacterium]
MHFDLGTLIWVGIVLFGVVSSMVKNARGTARPVPRASMQHAPLAATAFAQMPGPEQPQVVAPVVVPAAPVTPLVRRAVVIPPAAPPLLAPEAAQQTTVHGTAPWRGMFGRRADLVRAVVAAQVLGPPIALQEHTIWSPRHDASI